MAELAWAQDCLRNRSSPPGCASALTGEAFYWLVAGVAAAGEEPLGDGSGVARPNAHPCP